MAKRKSSKSPLSENHLNLQDIAPLTENQRIFFENYESDKSQFLLGYPGTGKTFNALFKAFQDINDPKTEYRRIVIIRSAVPTRDIGFLPGTEQEKSVVYELPYKKICSELFGRDDAYEIMKKHDTIRFMTTSFVRGITLDDTIVLVDEFQSMNAHELDSILTRIGRNSKILFCGDFMQSDLTRESEKHGAHKFFQVVQKMTNSFDINNFTAEDIVRSGIVKEYIKLKYSIFKAGF